MEILNRPDKQVIALGTVPAEEYTSFGGGVSLRRMFPGMRISYPDDIIAVETPQSGLVVGTAQFPRFINAIIETGDNIYTLLHGGVTKFDQSATLILGQETHSDPRGRVQMIEFNAEDLLPIGLKIGSKFELPGFTGGYISRLTVFERTFLVSDIAEQYERSDVVAAFAGVFNIPWHPRAFRQILIEGLDRRLLGLRNMQQVIG